MPMNSPKSEKMKRPHSQEIFRRATDVLVGGVNSPVRAFRAVGGDPIVVDHAAGARLWDADENEYIDYVCSWGALILGHAHPKVVEAIAGQARRGTSYGMPTELEVELASRIRRALPSCEKVRFVSSGTEATMSAVRLARAATGRDLLVKFDGCYHGHSDSFLSEAGSGLATLGNRRVSGRAGGTRGADAQCALQRRRGRGKTIRSESGIRSPRLSSNRLPRIWGSCRRRMDFCKVFATSRHVTVRC